MTVPSGSCVERLLIGFGQLGEDAAHVERQSRQPLEHLPFPDLPRAVPVDLDAVPVRVAEVDRLTHEMIGEAGQGDVVAPCMGEPTGEVDALGQQEGEMEETGVALFRLRAGLFNEHESSRALPRRARLGRRPARARSSPIASR